jgi:hypothetical protein
MQHLTWSPKTHPPPGPAGSATIAAQPGYTDAEVAGPPSPESAQEPVPAAVVIVMLGHSIMMRHDARLLIR